MSGLCICLRGRCFLDDSKQIRTYKSASPPSFMCTFGLGHHQNPGISPPTLSGFSSTKRAFAPPSFVVNTTCKRPRKLGTQLEQNPKAVKPVPSAAALTTDLVLPKDPRASHWLFCGEGLESAHLKQINWDGWDHITTIKSRHSRGLMRAHQSSAGSNQGLRRT